MATPELSERVKHMPEYAPRGIVSLAVAMGIDPGKCNRLHLGDTHYSLLPPQMASAMKGAIDNNQVHYTGSLGIPELRERIAGFYHEEYGVKVDPDQVVIDMGSTDGIAKTSLMFLNPGDYALVVNPAYPAYFGAIALAEGKAIHMPTRLEDGFKLTKLDMEDSLDKIVKQIGINPNRIKMMIFNNPNNPTGQYESIEGMRKIANFSDKFGAIVLADEAYLELVFDPYKENGDITSFLKITGTEDAIGMGTFSKLWAATGLRIAWRIIPKKYMNEVEKMQSQTFLSPAEPNQRAAIAAFDTPPEWYEENLRKIKQHRDLVLEYARSAGIVIPDSIVARSALYQIIPLTQIYRKGRENQRVKHARVRSDFMTKDLLRKEYVLATNGLGFLGAKCFDSKSRKDVREILRLNNDFIRISLCLPRDELEQGLEKLVRFIQDSYEVRDLV